MSLSFGKPRLEVECLLNPRPQPQSTKMRQTIERQILDRASVDSMTAQWLQTRGGHLSNIGALIVRLRFIILWHLSDIGAFIVRIGLWRPIYYSNKKEPPQK